MSQPQPYRATTCTLAVVSLVFGVLAWCMLPFIGALVAVICGHMARGEIRRAPEGQPLDGDGLAVAGLVLGYVQLALSLLAIAAIILLVFVLGIGHVWH